MSSNQLMFYLNTDKIKPCKVNWDTVHSSCTDKEKVFRVKKRKLFSLLCYSKEIDQVSFPGVLPWVNTVINKKKHEAKYPLDKKWSGFLVLSSGIKLKPGPENTLQWRMDRLGDHDHLWQWTLASQVFSFPIDTYSLT